MPPSSKYCNDTACTSLALVHFHGLATSIPLASTFSPSFDPSPARLLSSFATSHHVTDMLAMAPASRPIDAAKLTLYVGPNLDW